MKLNTKHLKNRKKINKKNISKKKGGAALTVKERFTFFRCVTEYLENKPELHDRPLYLIPYFLSCHSGLPPPPSISVGTRVVLPKELYSPVPETPEVITINDNMLHVFGTYCCKGACIIAAFSSKVCNWFLRETIDCGNSTGRYRVRNPDKIGFSSNNLTRLYRGETLPDSVLKFSNMPGPVNGQNNFVGIFHTEPIRLGTKEEIDRFNPHLNIDTSQLKLRQYLRNVDNLPGNKLMYTRNVLGLISKDSNKTKDNIATRDPTAHVFVIIIEVSCRGSGEDTYPHSFHRLSNCEKSSEYNSNTNCRVVKSENGTNTRGSRKRIKVNNSNVNWLSGVPNHISGNNYTPEGYELKPY